MNFNRTQIIAVSAIILLLLSFTFLDFGIKSSTTNKDEATSAYSSGEPESLLPGNLILYVHQQNDFDSILEKELVTALEETGYFVTLTDEIKDDYSSQFAFVNVIDMTTSYTPVYSKSDVDVRFGFSSTGRTQYLDIEGEDKDEPVVFSSEDREGYQLLIQGDLGLSDETKGLFTYRSYQNHVAKEIAMHIATGLNSQITMNR